MRLICGVIRLDGAPARPDALAAMAAALTAPGLSPRITRRIDGPAAMAVLDFAATAASGDTSLPQGPDGVWLAADLRLDRPAALAATLNQSAQAGPEALAGAALARWGTDLPDRMDGDFALAAWAPSRRRLLLARDAMGVRPLCWTFRPGQLFAFASLPRGLYASGLIPQRPDPLALGHFLVQSFTCGDQTGFADIAWLRAGHSLEASPDGVRVHRAWRPAPEQVGRWRGSALDAACEMRRLVEDAVHQRLPASGPVAAHLSGGLDSSTIAVIAARRLRAEGRSLHAFSQLATPSAFAGLRDESEYVAAVLAQEPDIVWSPTYPPPIAAAGLGDADIDLTGPMVLADECTCAAAAATGASLLLSGAGGDEAATYNGLNLYAAMLRSGRWRHLPAELRARARREGEPLHTAIAHRLLSPLLPTWLRNVRRRLLGRPVPPPHPQALDFLAPSLAAQVAFAPPAALWGNGPHGRIAKLTDNYVVGRNSWWAAMAARHGIAFGYPLLDRRVIDFALSLPLERFLDNGFSRQPFRNAMAGILPETVRQRPGKYVIYPDLPLLLAAAKPKILAQAASLRARQELAEIFDLEAIATALAAIPEGAEAERIARAANGPREATPPLQRSMFALRALRLASAAARME